MLTSVTATAQAATPTYTTISKQSAADPGFSKFGSSYYVYATGGGDGILPIFRGSSSLSKSSWLGKLVYTRILGGVFADKARGEAQLKSSSLDWTIVYPVTLTDKPASNNASDSPLEGTPKLWGMPKIARADVAAFLLQTVVNGSFAHQTVVLRPAN